jgi:hypothetical protein
MLDYLTLYDLTPGLIATVGWHVMCLGIDISHVVNYVPSYWWVMKDFSNNVKIAQSICFTTYWYTNIEYV